MTNKFLLVLSVIFIHCNIEQDIEKRSLEHLNKRKEEYFQNKLENCKRELMSKAERITDSMMITMSKSIKYDSLTIPTDTTKPIKPEVLFPDYIKPEKPKFDTAE
ncbi:MAG: hypothetical protein M3Q56_09705 [Bacteroidota bacterium]|nr:hypothetical protein [Bacteroidota bacterium]